MKAVYFVYNEKSGTTPELAVLKQKCREAGLDIKKFIPIDDLLKRRLSRPIASGATIIVLGGDGTMNTIANLLVGTQAVMAPIPGGTFNHFTKDLGIAQDLDEALKSLKKAKIKKVDTVSVNGTYFVNNSLLGLYPYSLQIRSTLEGVYGKWPAAILAVTKAITQFHTYRISINGVTYSTPFVFIGNNRFGLERLGLPGRHSFDEGVMSVYIARARSRKDIIVLSYATMLGHLKDMKEFEMLEIGKKFTVYTRRKHMRVSHDGELSRMKTPLKYELHPKSLRILA